MIKTMYVGFEYGPKNDWKDIMGPPKKPSNWKEETYNNKLDALRAKQAETAPQHLAAGNITQVSVLTVNDKRITRELMTAVDFVKQLHTLNVDNKCVIYGFELLHTLRQCGWQVAGLKGKPLPQWAWGVSVPFDQPAILVNLYSISGAKNDGISLKDMLKYWVPDLQANAATVLQGLPETDAEVMSAAAYTVAVRMGI